MATIEIIANKVYKPDIKWNLPRKAKNGKITYPVIIRIMTEKRNMINFLENIKYRYSSRYFRDRAESLDVLSGKKQIEQLRKYLKDPKMKVPPICVFLSQEKQKIIIDKAARRFSRKTNAVYKNLAKHLYTNCENLNNCYHLWNSYLSLWKRKKSFIPIDCVIELAKLCDINISDIQKEIKEVKYIRYQNRYAISYNGDKYDMSGN